MSMITSRASSVVMPDMRIVVTCLRVEWNSHHSAKTAGKAIGSILSTHPGPSQIHNPFRLGPPCCAGGSAAQLISRLNVKFLRLPQNTHTVGMIDQRAMVGNCKNLSSVNPHLRENVCTQNDHGRSQATGLRQACISAGKRSHVQPRVSQACFYSWKMIE